MPRSKTPPRASALIGCAGWAIPSEERPRFPDTGSQLERYASVFPAVEINSSFYRPHRRATYQRWAEAVPDHFRFSVKVPKTITHIARLRAVEPLMDTFLEEVSGLGEKLGSLLVQTPPSLGFDPGVGAAFFSSLRERTSAPIVVEPRHADWLGSEAREILRREKIAWVRADPCRLDASTFPISDRLVYYRLHGSPRMYYSEYMADFLRTLAGEIRCEQDKGHAVWCIFDNTAHGHALPNARQLLSLLGPLHSVGHAQSIRSVLCDDTV